MPKIYVIAQVTTDDDRPLSEAAAANLIQQAIGEHARQDQDHEQELSLAEEVLEVVVDVLSTHDKPKQIVKDLRKLLKIE